jgi:hypothetical protein
MGAEQESYQGNKQRMFRTDTHEQGGYNQPNSQAKE